MEENLSIPAAESETVEFKQQWTDTVKSDFCAFANTSGGTVYFGVDDDGNPVGVEDPDVVERSIISVFRFAMKPSCVSLCRVKRFEVEGKVIVVAYVLEGSSGPYWVSVHKEKGGKERKCFMRQGSSNYKADDDELRALYVKNNPVPYESRPASRQDLTFETLKRYFESAGVEFSDAKYRTLGLVNEVGFYTHLAHWVSDQSEVETRVGFFSGLDKASPVNGILTFSGCLIDQYRKVQELLYNRFGFSQAISAFSIRRDGTRNEVKEYPLAAVREALVNMFAHRDYSIENAQAFVSAFSDRLEFLSFGGLLRGVTPELLREGCSFPRNRNLADMLVRLSAMERYGLGIPLMYAAYKPFGLEPSIVCDPTKLKIVLPKVTAHYENLSEDEMQIVRFLRKNGAQPRAKIQSVLERSYTYTLGHLTSLLKQGVIVKEGAGKSTVYKLK